MLQPAGALPLALGGGLGRGSDTGMSHVGFRCVQDAATLAGAN
jgi:hypothetical protein